MSPSHRRSKWVAQTHWVRHGGKELGVAAALVVATALGLLSVADVPSLWGRPRVHPIRAGLPTAAASPLGASPAGQGASVALGRPLPAGALAPTPEAPTPEAAAPSQALPSSPPAASPARPSAVPSLRSAAPLLGLASPAAPRPALASSPQLGADPLSYPSPTPLWDEAAPPTARPRASLAPRPRALAPSARPARPLASRPPAPQPTRGAGAAPAPLSARPTPPLSHRPQVHPRPVAPSPRAPVPPPSPRPRQGSAGPGGHQVPPRRPLAPPRPHLASPGQAGGAEGAWALATDGRPKRHLAGGWRPWPGGRVGHVRQLVAQGQDLALGLAPQEQALWLLQWPTQPGAKAQAALVLGPPGAWGGAQARREGLRHPTSLAIAPQGDWVWVAEAKGGLVRYHLPSDRMERPSLSWGQGGPPKGALFLEPRQGAYAPLWEPQSGRRWRLRLQEGRLEPAGP